MSTVVFSTKVKWPLTLFFLLLLLPASAQDSLNRIRILASPNSRYNKVVLKDSSNYTAGSIRIDEGKKVYLGRSEFLWDQVARIELSPEGLQKYTPNEGIKVPVQYDSLAKEDVIYLLDGNKICGNMCEFIPYYQVGIKAGGFKPKKISLTKVQKVVLGKASPYLVYSDEYNNPLPAQGKNTPQKNIHINRNEASLSLETELPSDQLRRAWQIRGGNILSRKENVNLLYIGNKTDYGRMNMFGAGFNYGFDFIKLNIPDYSHKITGPLLITAGCDLNALFAGGWMDINLAGFDDASMSTTLLQLNLRGSIGIEKGLGKFLSQSRWAGIAVGFNWKPSFSYITGYNNYSAGNYSSDVNFHDSQFNLKGYEFIIERSNLNRIGTRYAKPSHKRFSIFILPPVGDSKTTLIMFGFGWIKY